MKGKWQWAFGAILLPALGWAQLTVTTNSVAASLAQTIGGNGVSVSNATLNCDSLGAGDFSYTGTNLGMSSGIVLTTGYASDAANAGTFFCSQNTGNTFSDPQLTAIDPSATNDACILEFDFVPICNSISITFVFGSEEYPTFVGSFNDAFGIFLSGPNPGGGTYNSMNIGVLPNGTPVSINNVNAGSNSGYFVDNYTNPNNDVAYDGYTVPVTSVTQVAPCSTYHMKIAIADALDQAYDSGVFIGNNAISCQNAPALTATATPAGCGGNTGSATATVTNYTGTVTYNWQPGGQTTQTASNLAAGTYTCTVGMQMSCGTFTQAVTATVGNTGAIITASTTATSPTCPGGSNGSATVAASGGTAPYTYTWTTSPAQVGATASNLAAGVYTVNIADNGGCLASATVSIANPPAIVPTVTTVPSICTANNGSAGVNISSGGTAPFTYTWSTSPLQTTQTATNLAPGTYTVVVSDVNTCTAVATGTVAQQNSAWTLTAATPTNVSCYNGSDGAATFTINNPGTSTFTYSWTTSPSQNTQLASNLPAGTYTCAVTDNTGCSLAVSVTVPQPMQLTVTTSQAPTICTASVGSATATPAGGTAPYSYNWTSNPAQTASVASNLPAGSYSVTVTDNNGCTTGSSVTIGTTIPTLTLTTSQAPTICTGAVGSASVTPTGGTAPYTYTWSSGQTTSTINSLPAGIFSVTVTDVNGCTANTAVTIGTTIQTVTAYGIATNAKCGSPTGAINLNSVSGGTAPYSFSWGTNPVQTTQNLVNVLPGTYTVGIIDQNGCIGTYSLTVGNDVGLPLTIDSDADICNSSIGSATVTPNGLAPYTYLWNTNPPVTSAVLSNVPVGNYSVTVTDAYGCTESIGVFVNNVNEILSSDFDIYPGEIYTGEPATLSINSNGWTLDSAILSDGNFQFNTNSLVHIFPQYGDYMVTYYFTSQYGCKESVTYPIKVTDFITLYIPNAFSPNGDGLNDEFKAQGTFIKSFEMAIFDRWGQLVMKSDDISMSWNGEFRGADAPQDTYVYKGKATDMLGRSIVFHGQVHLVR